MLKANHYYVPVVYLWIGTLNSHVLIPGLKKMKSRNEKTALMLTKPSISRYEDMTFSLIMKMLHNIRG